MLVIPVGVRIPGSISEIRVIRGWVRCRRRICEYLCSSVDSIVVDSRLGELGVLGG